MSLVLGLNEKTTYVIEHPDGTQIKINFAHKERPSKNGKNPASKKLIFDAPSHIKITRQ